MKIFITDALPPSLERQRARLVEERCRLKAMAVADADAELRERIAELEAAIRSLDAGGTK
jgi:hypothetical protein